MSPTVGQFRKNCLLDREESISYVVNSNITLRNRFLNTKNMSLNEAARNIAAFKTVTER